MSTKFSPRCVVVTGGAGFIGTNFIRRVLARRPGLTVVNYDALTYAGNLESLADVEAAHGPAGDGRYHFVRGDIRDAALLGRLLRGEADETVPPNGRARRVPEPDAVVHMAAESHVDRSILGPAAFIETNVLGTGVLLDACRTAWGADTAGRRFLHVGTDEVYGTLGPDDPPFTERTPIAPNSPYSASKAGSDLLVRAYVETYGLPALMTRCSNNYGPFQFPEKLIPLMITRALRDQALPVYGDGRNVRDWIQVVDHADGVLAALEHGEAGGVYNLGGENEMANLDVVRQILARLGKPESLITYVTDRPGHDRRYAMDVSYARSALGWAPAHSFEQGLGETVDWYVANPGWWERVMSEAYRSANALYLTA